jgi:plasmid stability protein
MDTTIRNLDELAYRELKARAALQGKTIGETINEAVRAYLRGAPRLTKDRSLSELTPRSYGPRSKRLSRDVDRIVYGVTR